VREDEGNVKQLGPRLWEVRSRTRPTESHIVTVTEQGGFNCSCRGYYYRRWCRHCNEIEAQLVPKSDVVSLVAGEVFA